MRLACLTSALLALAWASSADACCFFKCWGKDRRADDKIKASLANMRITQVNGIPVVSGEVVDKLNSNDFIIVTITSAAPCPAASLMKIGLSPSGVILNPTSGSLTSSGGTCQYQLTFPPGTFGPNMNYDIYGHVEIAGSPTTSPTVKIHTLP